LPENKRGIFKVVVNLRPPMKRRELFKAAGVAGIAALLPSVAFSCTAQEKSNFRFCLNTSTIRGQNLELIKNIEIAANAGYDGIELWVDDINEYRSTGKSLSDLKKFINDKGLRVENAIGFAPCFINDDSQRKEAVLRMQADMEMMAELGCKRIAAPPAGIEKDAMPDLFLMGKRYKDIIALGQKTGVMPQLEFWGASETLYQFGQALMVAASADDPNVRILADAYHMFRGDSGFEGLKMVNGNLIEIFHVNDYPGNIEREKQTDADRVFPGEGAAPLKQIFSDLKMMGGEKVLSLELFNSSYWSLDPLWVAKTGLEKMKTLAKEL
jgi:2-keto-myo-inositol isomerase